MEARIWSKKPEKNMNPDKNPNEKAVLKIDLTLEELKNPLSKLSMIPLFDFLKYFHAEDEEKCVGTTYVYFNENGNININFVTNLALPKESQEKMKKILRKYCKDQ